MNRSLTISAACLMTHGVLQKFGGHILRCAAKFTSHSAPLPMKAHASHCTTIGVVKW